MTSIIIIQVNIEKISKKKHSNSQNIKKNNEEKVSIIKNNENSEYSKAVEIINEKKKSNFRTFNKLSCK